MSKQPRAFGSVVTRFRRIRKLWISAQSVKPLFGLLSPRSSECRRHSCEHECYDTLTSTRPLLPFSRIDPSHLSAPSGDCLSLADLQCASQEVPRYVEVWSHMEHGLYGSRKPAEGTATSRVPRRPFRRDSQRLYLRAPVALWTLLWACAKWLKWALAQRTQKRLSLWSQVNLIRPFGLEVPNSGFRH